MRNIIFLINEARENTNTPDREAITDQLCANLLNRSLDHICSYLHNQNVRSRVFRKTIDISLELERVEYDLPDDVYIENSIINVSYMNSALSGNRLQRKFIPFIADKNIGNRFGYTVYRNKLILNPQPYGLGVVSVAYSARPPRFGLRYGQITAITDGVSITLDPQSKDMSLVDEFYCIVDSHGEIKRKKLLINYSGSDLLLSDTSDISVGDYVVPGKYATTHCPMPVDLEECFVSSLENLINARLSSKSLMISDAVSSELLDGISGAFADASEDEFVPPIMEYGEWI